MEVAHKTEDLPVDKKWLCQLSQVELKLIEIRLNNIALIVGIQGLVNIDLMKTLVQLIPQYYPRLTMEKMTQAFVDNAAGKLNCIENGKQLDKFITYHNSFDWSFVSNVLNAFERSEQEKRAEPPRQPLDVSRQLNPRSKMSEYKQDFLFICKWASQIKAVPPQANFWQSYVYAYEVYIIDPSMDEKKKIAIEVAGIINYEADKLQTPNDRQEYRKRFAKGTMDYKNKCMELFFTDWLEKEIRENINDLDKWFENILVKTNTLH